MLTRRARALGDQQKLNLALEKLKESKNLCNQLLQEREDSEVEIQKVVKKNSQLKSELAELHTTYTETLEQKRQLEDILIYFQRCNDTYEAEIKKVRDLEGKLCDSQREILDLQSQLQLHQNKKTDLLFSELMDIRSPFPVIDLTKDDSHSSKINSNHNMTSHNKIKRYIKINRFVRKTNKLIRQKQAFHKNIDIRKQNMNLKSEVSLYIKTLNELQEKHNNEIVLLNAEINNLKVCLDSLSQTYEDSQKQLQDHISAADHIIELSNYNLNRLESLQNKKCYCDCAVLSNEKTNSGGDICKTDKNTISSGNIVESSTLILSDKLGQKFGVLLSEQLPEQVTNYCMPNASFSALTNIIDRIELHKLNSIVILFGNSLIVKKRDILDLFKTLNKVDVKKVILCTLPYSSSLTDRQNNNIHYLNDLMYKLSNLSNKPFFLLDINDFVYDFRLTKYTLHMPKNSIYRIATLVANIIMKTISHSTNLIDLSCVVTNTMSRKVTKNDKNEPIACDSNSKNILN